jgi:hypothetical protein
MIVLALIIITILILLIILNIRKDSFIDPIDSELQTHIDDIRHIQSRNILDLNNDLYYYPYNDIYNKYKQSMSNYLCNKKKEVVEKVEYEKNKLSILEDKYQNLRRQISPNFNPIFDDFLQLNTYNSDNNDKIKYLKVKRFVDNSVNPPKSTFQIFTSAGGKKCLEVDNYNQYSSVDCNDYEEKQRFYIDYAYDKDTYEEIVKNPHFRYPEKAELLNYPITLLRSKSGNCVNLYNDNVSIEPCKYKTTQMFKMQPV